jgi:hypothetical protein
MSWGIAGGLGKAGAMRAAVAKQFAMQGKCSEPEETIKQAAAQIVDAALAGQDPNQVVEVSASGSQSTNGVAVVCNMLNIAVTPRYGFIE